MNKEEFKESFKSGFDKFVDSSKKVFGKAGNAVQDFSDKSVIRIEKKQFESKRNAQYEKLGEYVSKLFISSDSASLSMSDETVSSIVSEIKKFNDEIESREKLLENQKKEETSDSSESEKSDNASE